jgi:TolA-binding protein
MTSVPFSRSGELDFANGLYRQEKFQLAAEEYQQYLSQDPAGPEEDQARFYLGESLLQLQQLKEASQSFQKIWDKSQSAGASVPSDYAAQSLFRLGQIAGQLQDHASAIGHLKLFRTQYPDHPRRAQAEQLLSESAILAEDWALARSALDEAIRLSPEGAIRDRVDYLAARLLEKKGDLDQAAAGYDSLIDRWSSDPSKRVLLLDALYGRGLVAIRQKQDAKGAEVFARGRLLARGLPMEDSLALQEASARLALGELDAASSIVDQVKQKTSDDQTKAQSYYLTARLAARQGKVEPASQAVAEIQKIKGADNWLSPAQMTLAEAWIADTSRPASERASRIEELAGSVRDLPARDRIIYLASVAYLDAKQFDDAARLSLPQVQGASTKRKPPSEYVLGMARFYQGNWAESARILSEVGDLLDDASAGTAWLTAGKSLLKDPSLVEQEGNWKKILQRISQRDDGGKYLRLLGDDAYRDKKLDRAEEVFRQAVEHRQPDQPWASLGLGWTLFDSAKLDEAWGVFQSAMEKASAASPELAEAVYMMATIEQQQGKTESAKAGYARVFHDFETSPFALPAGQRWAKMLAQEKSPAADQALAELIERSPAGPVQASAIVDRAWLAIDRGEEARAREWLVRALDVPQGGASAVRGAIKLAELAQKEGKGAEAKGYLDRAEAIGVPESLEAAFRYRLGLVLKDLGEKVSAAESFQQVVERFSSTDFAKASLFALGELSFADKPADGIRFYRLLADRADAGNYGAVARLRLAQSHLKLGEWDEAANMAERLMNDSVEKAAREEATYVRARVFQQKAEFDRAREMYRSIIGGERTETAAKAQFMLAETLFLQERWNEAIKEFLKVSILYPIPEWQSLALVEVGKCHARQSQRGEAKKAFEEVIAKFGSLPAAEEAKKQLGLLGEPESSETGEGDL